MASLTSNLYAFGEFCMDPQNRVLRLRQEPVALTPKAFEVLLLLVQHSGQIVSKDELMRTVWPDSFVEESNLTQTVFMLRKALGETGNQRYILTVQGRGYRFAAEVKTIAENGYAKSDRSTTTVSSTAALQGEMRALIPEGNIAKSPYDATALPSPFGFDSATPSWRKTARL